MRGIRLARLLGVLLAVSVALPLSVKLFRALSVPHSHPSAAETLGHTVGYSQKFEIDHGREGRTAEHLRKFCRVLGVRRQHVEYKRELLRELLVDDRHKVIYCQIPKVACTNWRRMFVLLSGEVRTRDPLALPAADIHGALDEHLTYLGDLSPREIRQRLDTYFKFVFVREPFERLLSAYRNKFQAVFRGSNSSTNFFHQRFGRRIIRQFRANASAESLERGNDVSLLEFVRYITDPERKEALNEHWSQYYQLCHPCLVDYDFIGRHETQEEDAAYVLNRIGSDLKFPSRSESYKHRPTGELLQEYYGQLPPSLFTKLWDLYLPDFVLFNYTVPEILRPLIIPRENN